MFIPAFDDDMIHAHVPKSNTIMETDLADNNKRMCRYCGKYGHDARNCPFKKNGH